MIRVIHRVCGGFHCKRTLKNEFLFSCGVITVVGAGFQLCLFHTEYAGAVIKTCGIAGTQRSHLLILLIAEQCKELADYIFSSCNFVVRKDRIVDENRTCAALPCNRLTQPFADGTYRHISRTLIDQRFYHLAIYIGSYLFLAVQVNGDTSIGCSDLAAIDCESNRTQQQAANQADNRDAKTLFHMNYLLKRFVYLYYTSCRKARNRSAEFGRSGAVKCTKKGRQLLKLSSMILQIQNNLYSILIILLIDLHCAADLFYCGTDVFQPITMNTLAFLRRKFWVIGIGNAVIQNTVLLS